SSTSGGAAINITDDGEGLHRFIRLSDIPSNPDFDTNGSNGGGEIFEFRYDNLPASSTTEQVLQLSPEWQSLLTLDSKNKASVASFEYDDGVNPSETATIRQYLDTTQAEVYVTTDSTEAVQARTAAGIDSGKTAA